MNINELNRLIEAKNLEIANEFKNFGGAPENMSADDIKSLEAKEIELNDLIAKKEKLTKLENLSAKVSDAVKSFNTVDRLPVASLGASDEVKTIGSAFVKNGAPDGKAVLLEGLNMKTLFSRTAGLAPERLRNGHTDWALRNELNLFDVFRVIPMKGDGFKYMRETITTPGAAELAEGGTYAEAQMSHAEVSVVAKKVGVILPVTDEVLADNEMLQDELDSRLTFLMRERFESQFINGDGTSNTVLGMISTTNVLTHTRITGENNGDAMIYGASKIRAAKAGTANLYIMNIVDFTELRLLKDSAGNYLYASLREGVQPTLDGLPVLISDAVPANKALAVDTRHVAIGIRTEPEIEVGYTGSNFAEGKKSMRGTLRGEAVIYRPQAICVIDITVPA